MHFDKRKSGISLIGDLPWGSHFCQFYQTRKDLLDVLVPYFKAGLENNELCVWVTPEGLDVEVAKKALKKAVPHFETYSKNGRIEIIPSGLWHARGGKSGKAIASRVDKAISEGLDGLRLACTAFSGKKNSKAFFCYGTDVINRDNIIAAFTYPRDEFDAVGLMEVVKNHRFALLQNAGKWKIIESSEARTIKDALKRSEEKLQSLFHNMSEGFAYHKIILDDKGKPCDYVFLNVNEAFERLTGLKRENIIGKKVTEALPGIEKDAANWIGRYGKVALTERPGHFDIYSERLRKWYSVSAFCPHKGYFAVTFGDITERKQAEEAIRDAFKESERREKEVSALLQASRAVLGQREFKDTARTIFDACKGLIGARAGYVALLSKDSIENEVLFLEPGGLSCTVDPGLPMPVRGLRAMAYHKQEVVYDNDFSRSGWMKYMPEGHVTLDNVLFAPLIISDKAVGLLGLANKPGGFTANDARLAAAFGELAAVALQNSRLLGSLASSEERFRSLAETASDAIISADSEGNIFFWNRSAESMFGYSSAEAIGRPLTMIMPGRLCEHHKQGMERFVSTGKKHVIGRSVELTGLRKDGTEFPLELALSKWNTQQGLFFTGVIRDITERKWAEEEILRLNEELKQHVIHLEAANKELESFSYSVSHDLRTPLRSINGFTQQILEDCFDKLDEGSKDAFRRISTASKRMGLLIDGLLNLCRLSRSGIACGKVDLSALARDIIENLKKAHPEREVEIVIAEGLLDEGDERLLYVLLQNLLGNAWKFTERVPKARLEFGARRIYGETLYFVRDNGAGFEMVYADKLFRPFQRLHDTTEFSGTGIGLATVQRIIHRHGGRVWAEGEVDKGATFYFTVK